MARHPWPIDPPLSVFNYSQVQLLDGPFREQFDHNHDLFLHLDEDALLKPFRQREGMPAPGPDMGGWYDNEQRLQSSRQFSFVYSGAQLRTVSLRVGTRLRRHRIETDAGENSPPGPWFRGNRGTTGEVLCGLPSAGLHLRQDQLRTDRCSRVRAGSRMPSMYTGVPPRLSCLICRRKLSVAPNNGLVLTKMLLTPGTKPTPFRKISFWLTSAAETLAIATWPSASSKKTTSALWRKDTTCFPENMPTATSTR